MRLALAPDVLWVWNRLMKRIALLLGLGMIAHAHAEGLTDTYLRVVGTYGFVSKMEPLDTVYGLGVDFGAYTHSEWTFGFMGRFLPSQEETGLTPSGATSKLEARTLMLAAGPSYVLKSDHARTSFGAVAGLAQMRTEVGTSAISSSRFLLGPQANVDLSVGATTFLSIGIAYLPTFGDSPKPSFTLFSAGLGFSL